MQRPPRDSARGIFTRPVVTLMSVGGVWSGIVNLGVFAGTRALGGTVREAMTHTFVSLVLIQFFKAYSYRSDRHSVLHDPFANRWLNLAICWEVLLLIGIISHSADHPRLARRAESAMVRLLHPRAGKRSVLTRGPLVGYTTLVQVPGEVTTRFHAAEQALLRYVGVRFAFRMHNVDAVRTLKRVRLNAAVKAYERLKSSGLPNVLAAALFRQGSLHQDYAEALAEAQALGYAEPDPTADVGGADAAAKAAILASLAFGAWVGLDHVPYQGIDDLGLDDIERELDDPLISPGDRWRHIWRVGHVDLIGVSGGCASASRDGRIVSAPSSRRLCRTATTGNTKHSGRAQPASHSQSSAGSQRRQLCSRRSRCSAMP